MKIKFDTEIFGKQFIYFDSISSTNDYMKNNIDKLNHGAVILTTNQTNGRGSKNHSWSSVENESIALSVLIKNIPVQFLKISSIMTAISIIDMLDVVGIENSKIKWFNDILIKNKKVAGLLCESVIQGECADIVLGIGMNINSSELMFQQLGLNHAGSLLTQTGKKYSIALIVKLLIESIENNFKKLSTNNITIVESFFIDRYISKCVTIGKMVKILKKDSVVIAKAIGISSEGALICEKDNVCFEVRGDEVSIRGIENYIDLC